MMVLFLCGPQAVPFKFELDLKKVLHVYGTSEK